MGVFGFPKFAEMSNTDYNIELIDPAESDDTTPHSYIDKRSNAMLRFSLGDVPIVRDHN